jgi:DNA-binding XRE family transcriptional regulator/molybdate-binding protein
MSQNRLRGFRLEAGLTQGELATRAGVSRQLVGAVEAGRHLPRVDAGLALAAALGVDVGRLFGSDGVASDVVSGLKPEDGSVVRLGWVGDRIVTAPARIGGDGWEAADAVAEGGRMAPFGDLNPGAVVAGCEPGLETLEHLLRQGGSGALSVATSSGAALDALVAGRAHAAVVHGPLGKLPSVPSAPAVVRVRLTGWQVGLAIPPDIGSSWWQQVLDGELAVVQRESGAAVQRTFEEAVGGSTTSGPRVGGHVVAARHGAAAGMPALTVEPAALAVGAEFHPLDRHEVELWVGEEWTADRGVEQLIDLISSSRFRRRLETVGGYDLDRIGSRVA